MKLYYVSEEAGIEFTPRISTHNYEKIKSDVIFAINDYNTINVSGRKS